jgi:hypothetical protein
MEFDQHCDTILFDRSRAHTSWKEVADIFCQ